MPTKRIFLYFAVFALIGLGILSFWPHSPDPAARLAAEREVYARLLREQESPDIKTQQIVAQTNSGWIQGNAPLDRAGLYGSFNQDDFPGLQRGTWTDFQEQNEESYPIKDYLPSTANVLLIDPANSEQLHWWLSYSRIGFNSSLTQALVLVGDCRGDACYDPAGIYMYSIGTYVFLQKKEGEWVIQDQSEVWRIEAPSP